MHGHVPENTSRGNRLSADKKIDVVALENGVFTVFSGVYLFFDGG